MSDLTANATATKSGLVARIFKDHPATVGETYFGHMRFALWFSGKLFKAGTGALAHALIPAVCETTASRTIRELYAVMEARAKSHH